MGRESGRDIVRSCPFTHATDCPVCSHLYWKYFWFRFRWGTALGERTQPTWSVFNTLTQELWVITDSIHTSAQLDFTQISQLSGFNQFGKNLHVHFLQVTSRREQCKSPIVAAFSHWSWILLHQHQVLPSAWGTVILCKVAMEVAGGWDGWRELDTTCRPRDNDRRKALGEKPGSALNAGGGKLLRTTGCPFTQPPRRGY